MLVYNKHKLELVYLWSVAVKVMYVQFATHISSVRVVFVNYKAPLRKT